MELLCIVKSNTIQAVAYKIIIRYSEICMIFGIIIVESLKVFIHLS